ncbi:hypothetical protein ACHAWF_009885 [Thalassiosira exigua]
MSLILAFQSIRIPPTLAFCRASSFAAGNFRSESTSSFSMSHDGVSELGGSVKSDPKHQLFGRFKISQSQIFHRSEHTFAMVNLRPLVPGHVLICSARVTPLLSDLDDAEHDDLWRTVRSVQTVLKQQYKCDAFNVAVQDGAGAGQSVPHVHVHILPRYRGDLERNDDIYEQLDDWAPRDEMSKNKPKLDTPDDNERRDRTMEEMENESALYRSLMSTQSC